MKRFQVSIHGQLLGRLLLLCSCALLSVACTLTPAAPTLTPTPLAPSTSDAPAASLQATATPVVVDLSATEVATTTDVISVAVTTDAGSELVTAELPTTTLPLTATLQQTTAQQTTAQQTTAITTGMVAAPAGEDKINEPVVAVVVGVNAALDPFVDVDEAGQLVGFDIDLINALAQAAGVEVSFVDMDFNELIPSIVAGEIDLAISAITQTEERATQVAFTEPYFTTEQSPVSFFQGGQGLAVRTETTTIQSVADLTADVQVGVKSGTTGDFFVVENSAAQIVRFDEVPPALEALANGQIDAVVTDISVIAKFVTDHPTANVQLMGKPLTVEEYAIAVSQERPDLLQIFNAALVRLREDDSYDQIVEKWFQLP